MHHDEADVELVQTIKRLWSDFGRLLIASILLFILGCLGWQRWVAYQQHTHLVSATLYEQLTDAVEHDEPISSAANHLMQQSNNMAYLCLTRLLLAKEALQVHDQALAKAHLEWVLAHAPYALIQDTARLRLSRLALDQLHPKLALKLLDQHQLESRNQALVSFLRAHAYQQLGQKEQAAACAQLAVQRLPVGAPPEIANWMILNRGDR